MYAQTKLMVGTMLLLGALQAGAGEITFYEGEGFRGQVFTTDHPVANLSRYGFNDRASSVVVESGRWEVCEDARFSGHCTLLRRGSYDSLESMGINNRISSVRPVEGRRNTEYEAREPLPQPTYEYRRRPDERLFEAPVRSVHAVVGPPEERCWVDREEVSGGGGRSNPNVGGAIAGAIIGGVLGHQIGGGSGRDIATAGGAVVGGAIGANAGRGGSGGYDREVRRCEQVADRTPDYWDVTYEFEGVIHRVQLTTPPGRSVLVNRDGEPRV